MKPDYETLSPEGIDTQKPTIAVIVSADRAPTAMAVLRALKEANLDSINIVVAHDRAQINALSIDAIAKTAHDVEEFARNPEKMLSLAGPAQKPFAVMNTSASDRRPAHLQHLGARITSVRGGRNKRR